MRNKLLFLSCIFTFFATHVFDAAGQSPCTGSQALTEAKCVSDDNSPAEHVLFDLVNRYRTSAEKPALKLSAPLSLIANRRLLDLKYNMKTLTHSWSNCRYDIKNEKTWHCVLDAPARFKTGYNGRGFEALYRTTTSAAAPIDALEAWKKSSLHNSIILNLDGFKDMPWDAVGIAIDGQYAALWFGTPSGGIPRIPDGQLGLGVSYQEAVAGLSRMLSIKLSSSTVDNNRWSGATPDGSLILEISGATKEINEANIAATLKLSQGSKLNPTSQQITAIMLRNIFPEWKDVDLWLDQSVAAVTAGPLALRVKLIRKISVEMRAVGRNSITILIRPPGPPLAYQEF
jgi:uncharacterized protein YkwD